MTVNNSNELRLGAEHQRLIKILKRNERERNRVHQVNLGYAILSNIVPTTRNKKVSKVETLRHATKYILFLRQLLIETSPNGQRQTGPSATATSMTIMAKSAASTETNDMLTTIADHRLWQPIPDYNIRISKTTIC